MKKPIRKNPGIEREAARPEVKWTLKAGAPWEDVIDFDREDNPDKLNIPIDMIPEGMDLLWVTNEVLGKPFPEMRSARQQNGWAPVHQSDFNARYDGWFMAKGVEGEITKGGSVLMTRPMKYSIKARQAEKRRALEQVAIKEQSVTGGDMRGITLDTTHDTALRSNRINKSVERIAIPED